MAKDMVNFPPHYTGHPSGIECIEITRHMSYGVGNAVKYMWRAHLKNGNEDYRKAAWYLRDAVASEAPVFTGVDYRSWQLTIEDVCAAEEDENLFMFLRAIEHGELQRALFIAETKSLDE